MQERPYSLPTLVLELSVPAGKLMQEISTGLPATGVLLPTETHVSCLMKCPEEREIGLRETNVVVLCYLLACACVFVCECVRVHAIEMGRRHEGHEI